MGGREKEEEGIGDWRCVETRWTLCIWEANLKWEGLDVGVGRLGSIGQ